MMKNKATGNLCAQVLQPGIELAEQGFPVAPVTAYHWAESVPQLRGPGKAAFLTANSRAPAAGEIQKNPHLGATFRSLAEHGALEGEFFTFEVLHPLHMRLCALLTVAWCIRCMMHIPVHLSSGRAQQCVAALTIEKLPFICGIRPSDTGGASARSQLYIHRKLPCEHAPNTNTHVRPSMASWVPSMQGFTRGG